jgi:hypothetical protein
MRAKILIGFVLASAAVLGVTLTWDANPPLDNVSRYNLYLSSTNVASSPSNSIAFPTIPGINYTFAVTAVNTDGIESLPSESLSYTEPIPLSVPSSPQITNSIWQKYQGNWYVQVGWTTLTNATAYIVTLDNGSIRQSLTTTNHTFSSVTMPFTAWTIYVQAQNAAGLSPLNSFASSPRIPATPAGIKVQ